MDTLPPEVAAVVDAAMKVVERSSVGSLEQLHQAVEAYRKLNAPPPAVEVYATRAVGRKYQVDDPGYPDGWDRVYGAPAMIGELEELWRVELRPIQRVA